MFLIGYAPGTGKTFLLGGVISELRDQYGVERFIYLTENRALIDQVRKDLEPYGVGVWNSTPITLPGCGRKRAIR